MSFQGSLPGLSKSRCYTKFIIKPFLQGSGEITLVCPRSETDSQTDSQTDLETDLETGSEADSETDSSAVDSLPLDLTVKAPRASPIQPSAECQ